MGTGVSLLTGTEAPTTLMAPAAIGALRDTEFGGKLRLRPRLIHRLHQVAAICAVPCVAASAIVPGIVRYAVFLV